MMKCSVFIETINLNIIRIELKLDQRCLSYDEGDFMEAQHFIFSDL